MAVLKNGECEVITKQVQDYIEAEASRSEAQLLTTFAKRYILASPTDDLEQISVSDLYAMIRSVWSLIYQRAPKETKIRIFNPDKKNDGWQTSHTVIEISHDDIPFLVDSIRMVINQYGYQIHYIVHFGGLKVKRDNKNRITEILANGMVDKDTFSEAPIYIEIDHLSEEKDMEELKADFERVLGDVRASVEDWRKMVARAEDCLTELESTSSGLDSAEVVESRDFIRWLINNNFTFMGARDFKLIGDGTNRALQVIPGSGLGVLRDESLTTRSKSYSELPPQARKMALSKNILIIAKTNTISTVHRHTYTDYIGVKRFNDKGELIGERRFIGLYTSTAYHSSPRTIPFLRHKVDNVIKDLGFPPDSHDGKEAVHILETLPRDDLFQATHEELVNLTLAIIQLKERKRVRLLVRRDAFYRYFSCLVYAPRDIFTTELANAMQDILMKHFQGLEASFTTYFSDSILARIHFLVRVNPKATIEYNVKQIEDELAIVARSWFDNLKAQLIQRHGEALGLRYFSKYNKAIPASYTENYSTGEAIDDIAAIEALTKENPLGMLIYKPHNGNAISLKIFHAEKIVILSDVLPILENMGLRIIGERPHEIKFKDGSRVWINDFDMVYSTAKQIDVDYIKDIFQDAFRKVWFGEAENDGFNRLVLDANLTWQETAMLRTYTKYLRQIGFNFSQAYIEQTLVNNVEVAKALVQLFIVRFDPDYQSRERKEANELVAYIEQTLESVSSLDEDRILRRLLEVIQATIRTNYFQLADGKQKSYLSVKFDPSLISDLPLPRPKFEIFVYAPFVEGIHLRAGKVARGGLRWSDRREDFRTEVLGLMKAQQVKNTVIVPEGAKGGFVVKSPLTSDMSRDDYLKEGVRCYSTFISGLLDITDNIIEGKVVPPERVVRYDEEDPYLVVAADKGTATFSDIANGIAHKYNFWLDDAFASGGSAGYDHKKMGITSRGVWVSVQRHFREIGINPATEDFTVIGIGDMSGDVFGNGLLMSNHTKLVAAYNHQHIFLDPDPNSEKSYEERKRLFNLPRSTWLDYEQSLISKGGGVYNRTAKSIKLTPEVKQLLKVEKDSMVPNELINAILKAPADLLWNGGIGTFAKATTETHADVGDRTNDPIRVDATDLRVRVIAEGGNLGMTQLARIEYSLNGGIVNTDFIDNSAGVDCSDHEVNIKILLNQIVAQKKLTKEDRNKLLERMTDEVAQLVLLDNYEQTQILSLEASASEQTMDLYRYYMNDLEKAGRLDRKLEFLPDDKSLLERKANNKPLTRPEIAMLLAYNKMYLKRDIATLDVIDDPYFDTYLLSAFPKLLQENYLREMKHHSLRKEIVSTQLCKAITDRMGINFVERLQRETGAAMTFIIRSYVIALHMFNMEELWQQIIKLDYKVRADVQYRMMFHVYLLIRRATRWLLRNKKQNIEIQNTISEFAPHLNKLIDNLPSLLEGTDKAAYDGIVNYLAEQGVPDYLASNIARCNALFTALDIVEASNKHNLDLLNVAKTYYLVGDRLELNWLRESMNTYTVDNQWDELARAGFRDDMDRIQREICTKILMTKDKSKQDAGIETKLNNWVEKHKIFVDRWHQLIADVKSTDSVDFVTYSVVLRELFDFAQAT